MGWEIRNVITSALLPPGLLLFIGFVGLLLLPRRPRVGACLSAFALITLYALSTRFVAVALLQSLEPAHRDPVAAGGAGAIVVLGAGVYFNAPEFGADTINAAALERLRYAAHLHRLTRAPILASGGSPEGTGTGEARHMKRVLEGDFRVPVTWIEDTSRTTLENARHTHAILSAAGIRTVYLVTHAWHMPRAKLAFENAGFTVIPAATGHATRFRLTALDFVPDARALRDSSLYFHEMLGYAWYRLQFALRRAISSRDAPHITARERAHEGTHQMD
jgi:uncharacterized SAM-binding protein YcdF (DUF218 family)